MDYEVDTDINKFALDDEWVKQANLFKEYSKKANDAYDLYNNLKNYYTVKKAEIEMDIRSAKIDIGCKITENAISAYLDTHQTLIEINNKISKAKYTYDMWKSAVDAMEHKKKSLDNLEKLWLNNYYADDRIKDR